MIRIELRVPKLKETPEEVDIIVDNDGLESLLSQLKMLSEGKTDHVHLMSRSWGGTHLEDSVKGTESSVIRHVKIAVEKYNYMGL